jgi:hypothetical protein
VIKQAKYPHTTPRREGDLISPLYWRIEVIRQRGLQHPRPCNGRYSGAQ